MLKKRLNLKKKKLEATV